VGCARTWLHVRLCGDDELLVGIPMARVITLLPALLVFSIFTAVFGVHARWIFTHFSSDGYLCDSGWLAFLFEAGGPLLRNPSAVVGQACSGINQPSFHANHLSPHIFLFGAPLSRVFNLSGIKILAYHQGLFFGLFFVSLYLTVDVGPLPYTYRIIATVSSVLIGTVANPLLQAAAYPHYEIAMVALASLAVAAQLGNYHGLFVFCLIWLPLIREDGGLYAAFACVACLALEHRPDHRIRPNPRRLEILAVIETIVSICAFIAKARFFPGFDAFSKNFSGQLWDHVTFQFLAERFQRTITSLNIAPVFAGSILLTIWDIRYATGLVLLSPWYLLHMLAVRQEHGHFTLYFALPWLLPAMLCLALFARRAKVSVVSRAESALIVLLSVALAAPFQAAVGARGEFWYVARWAVTRPVTNIEGMKDFVLWVRRNYSTESGDRGPGKMCVSMGIAALVPNHLDPDEVLDADSDVSACGNLLLLRADMHYGVLSARAEALGFMRVAARYNAELWRPWNR
jgi:hypothetical protein